MEKRAAVARAWAYLNFKPAAQWLALGAGVASCIVYVLLLLVFGWFVYLLVHPGERPPFVGRFPWLQFGPDNLSQFAGLAGTALLFALLMALLLYAMHHEANVAAGEAAQRMRKAIYHHSYRLGSMAFRTTGPAETVSVFSSHVEAIQDALYAWLTVTLREPVLVALLVLTAFIIHFWLTLVALAVTALAWLIAWQVAGYCRRRQVRAMQQAAHQLALLQGNLQLLRLIKGYMMELFNQGRFDRQLSGYGRARRQQAGSDALFLSLVALIVAAAAVAILFIAGLAIQDGQLGLPAATLLAALLGSVYPSVRRWLAQRPILQRGEESAVVLVQFLDRPRDVAQEAGAETLPRFNGRLELDNVTLRDPGSNRTLLNGISLTIAADRHVALVGPDDLEKHALVYLLPRFLDPTSGEIRIDEHNLRWVTLDSLRKQIALVLQHQLVFNDTAVHNISCGDSAVPLPQVVEAAKLAHAHQFIQKLPKGYDTLIGDLGHSLTVGEKFRIALARAILRNPALLVIEEPPAAYLDEDTCDLLDDTFARLLPGRTVVFLPHRLKTLHGADEVLLLYKGRIEARGAHSELEQNALYQHLYYLEFNDFAGKL
jgi:ATP-binding cassette subfamily B protein